MCRALLLLVMWLPRALAGKPHCTPPQNPGQILWEVACGLQLPKPRKQLPLLRREEVGLGRSGPGCGPRLRVLSLRSCAEAVTDELLGGFLPRAAGLERLDVAHCSALTDLSAVLLGGLFRRGGRALRVVDLSGCFRIGHRGRAQLHALQRTAAVAFVGLDEDDDDDEGGSPPAAGASSPRALGRVLEQLEQMTL